MREFRVVAEERRRQGHHVRAQLRATAVRAGAFAGQRPTCVVDQEFLRIEVLIWQSAPQQVLVPVKIHNELCKSLTMCQRFRFGGGLHVAAGETWYEQDRVSLFDDASEVVGLVAVSVELWVRLAVRVGQAAVGQLWRGGAAHGQPSGPVG